MRNCKQVISMILVLAMLFAVVSVGMVQVTRSFTKIPRLNRRC